MKNKSEFHLHRFLLIAPSLRSSRFPISLSLNLFKVQIRFDLGIRLNSLSDISLFHLSWISQVFYSIINFIETGLYFLLSDIHILTIGVSFVILQSSGVLLSIDDFSNMIYIGVAIESAQFFEIRGWIPFAPGDFDSLSLFIFSMIYVRLIFLSISLIQKLVFVLL